MAEANVAAYREPVNVLYELIFPNGKSYWGITQETAEERFWKGHVPLARRYSKSRISKAIRKHGAETVKIFTRIIGNRHFVEQMEIAAIAAFRTDNIKYGYNIAPGGKLVADAVREANLWITNGKLNTKISDSDEMPDGWRKGRVLSRAHIKAIANGQKRPEVIEKKRQIFLKRMTGRVWITDGVRNRKVLPDQNVPSGWYLGMTISQTHRQKMIEGLRSPTSNAKQKAAWAKNREQRLAALKTAMSDPSVQSKRSESHRKTAKKHPLIWITNGSETVRQRAENPIPIGWKLGRTIHWSESLKNLIWINNKVENRRIRIGSKIPDGWVFGQIKKK